MKLHSLYMVVICISTIACTSTDISTDAPLNHSGYWVIDNQRSSWSDGRFPPTMSIKVKMTVDDSGVVYSSVNDTCQVTPPDQRPELCASFRKPYTVDFAATFDQAVHPVENQSRYNQVTIRRFNENEYEIRKMKDGDLILAEFWTFRPNGTEFIRRGVSLKSNRTYNEYFTRTE